MSGLHHSALAFTEAASQTTLQPTLSHINREVVPSTGPGVGCLPQPLSLPLLVPTPKEGTVIASSGPCAQPGTSLMAQGQLGYPNLPKPWLLLVKPLALPADDED